MSKKLGQVTGRPKRDDPWVEPDAARKALPGDAVLVEIARVKVFDFQTKDRQKRWQPPHYAAWVIPAVGRGEIRVIDLGEAKPIEDAVAAARKALQPELDVLRSRGEPDAEQQLQKPLQDLARLVLQPLLPHIGQAKRWLISPDAALWLVPWAALPLPDGRYAVEGHLISYVISGRDLVADLGSKASERPIVLADPDYDLDPAQARATTRQMLRERAGPEPAQEPLLALRGSSRSLAGATFAHLPGTAAEAEAVLPRLTRYAGIEPQLYAGPQALEAVFKAVQRPRIVMLSTHGFFLEEPETKLEDRPALALDGGRSPAKPGPLPENPLLRCGLVLAGANQRDQASGPEDEDGILTGLEIVGTDLRGTELVVLSACETGLGEVRNGEGVAGLRQAFQLAGAQAVLATLWQVPDRESARLMSGFFDNLAAGRSRPAALRDAQLALIAARRERYSAAHPFFWAAFTLTGQPGEPWKTE
ncbi:MAG: CHAT domain-containing protein [Isosphaeraceae bacterium]